MKIRFNIENLMALYVASKELKKDFGKAIFGGTSRMGPEYFKNINSINFRHLENLCEHYNKAPSYFISFDQSSSDTSSDTYNNVSGVVSHSQVEGDVTINNSEDIDTLLKTIQNLEEVIKQKDDVIADKCEQINWMKSQWSNVIDVLKSQNN